MYTARSNLRKATLPFQKPPLRIQFSTQLRHRAVKTKCSCYYPLLCFFTIFL